MRIQQSSTFLNAVLDHVEAGRFVPALFQRPYVWGTEDVEAFWTSVVERYPLGSFLLWTPTPDIDVTAVGRRRIGPVMAEAGPYSSLVLDGQNRLASYAWSLADTTAPGWREAFEASLPEGSELSPDEAATWFSGTFLAADPDERTVRFRRPEEAETSLLVPAALLADTRRLWKFLRAHPAWRDETMSDAQMEWLNDAAQAMMEARVTVTDLREATREDALKAFRHIARVGQPISEEHFEAALAFAFPDAAAPGPR